MENTCRRIEEHLLFLQSLVNDVKDIGYATLCSNRKIPSPAYNQAFRVNVPETETDKLITEVIKYYTSIGLKPHFTVSPATRPPTFANSLQQAGFKLVLEEDAMIYKGQTKNPTTNPDVNVVADDGNLLDVWTDVSMKSFGTPTVLRDALIDIHKKAIQYEGTKPYLGYFQGKPAGVCGLISHNKTGGIFTVGTDPEHRKKGIATALLQKAITDSTNIGNNLLYLITTKGSEAEKLYTSLGFEVAYAHLRYGLQPQKQ